MSKEKESASYLRSIEAVGFDQPRYTYKGMPIYESNSIPEGEIHMYDTLTGHITILIIDAAKKPRTPCCEALTDNGVCCKCRRKIDGTTQVRE